MMRVLSLLTLGFAVVLSACSCYIQLTAVGSLPGPITAQFPEALRIERLLVERLEHKGHWARVWEASGSAKLSSITYGAVPQGLRQLASPEPLRRKQIYHAMIQTPPSLFGPPCGGGVIFWITADGQVRTCSSPTCERQLLSGKIPE